jgi:hypothetical protein
MTKWEDSNKKLKYGYVWNSVWDPISHCMTQVIWKLVADAIYQPVRDNNVRLSMRDIYNLRPWTGE